MLTQRNILTAHGEGVEMIKSLPFQDLHEQQDPIVEEAVNVDHILNFNHQGNTSLVGVKPLLAGGATTVDVNRKNGDGETALGTLPSDTNHQEIGLLLLETGAEQGAAAGGHVSVTIDEPLLPSSSSSFGSGSSSNSGSGSSSSSSSSSSSYEYNNHSLAQSSMETKGILLMVLVLFVSISFNVVSNPPSLVMEARQEVAAPAAFRFGDVIRGRMPASFYLLVGSTTVFATSMVGMAVIVYFLPWVVVSEFAGLAVVVVYSLLVDKAMPRCTVKIGSFMSFSGSLFVWVSAVALVCCGVTVGFVLKNVCSCAFVGGLKITSINYKKFP